MFEHRPLVAFVATADGDRARRFYSDVLGLPVVSDDSFALVCRARGVTLRVQKVPSFRPQPFTALGWEVDDIADTVDALAKRGVAFERYEGMDQDARGIWTAPSGTRIAWFKDPDGNTLSISAS